MKPSPFFESIEFDVVKQDTPTHLQCLVQPHHRMSTVRLVDGKCKGGIGSPHKPGKSYFPHTPHRVGFNGHDPINKQTFAVPIDFDVDHGAKAITPEQRDTIIASVEQHQPPGVILCHSTGGSGLHLWILLETPIPTPGDTLEEQNAQHQLNCRRACCVLNSMLPDINLPPLVDVIGQNTWVYTSTPKPDSFRLIYESDARFPAVDPSTPIQGFPTSHGAIKKSGVELADMTPRQWEVLDRLDCSLNYDHASNIISGHSAAFLPIADELVGVSYKLDNPGSRLHEPNCVIIPLKERGFIVALYGTSVDKPGPNWWLSGSHHWCCFVDVFPSLDDLADYQDGEIIGKDTVFTGPDRASVLRACGLTTDLPNDLDLYVRDTNKGRVFRQPKDETEDNPGKAGQRRGSFIYNRGWWTHTLKKSREERKKKTKVKVVALVEHGKSVGVRLCDPQGDETIASSWIDHGPRTANVITRQGYSPDQAVDVIQRAEANYMHVDYRPLMPLFLPPIEGGPRERMNLTQVQYNATPATGEFPFIRSIFAHLGKNLTPYVVDSPACQQLGIVDGPDYLRHWACMTLKALDKRPRLPAIQMFGPKSGGKSAWWLLFSSLLRGGRGVASIYRAVTSDTGFNKVLQDCIVAYLDEKDCSRSKIRDSFKEMVSATKVDIRKMQTDEYRIDATFSIFAAYNYLNHGVHDLEDRRCIFLQVDPLPADVRVSDTQFQERVKSEAAAFLHHVQQYEPLDSKRPLYLPVLVTAGKVEGWRAIEDTDKPSSPNAYRLHESYRLAQWIDHNKIESGRVGQLVTDSGVSLGPRQVGELLRVVAGDGNASVKDGWKMDAGWFTRRGISVATAKDKNTTVYQFTYGDPQPYEEH